MKHILIDIAKFLVGAVVFILFLYLRLKASEAYTKDLGDGGIQRLFGNRKLR